MATKDWKLSKDNPAVTVVNDDRYSNLNLNQSFFQASDDADDKFLKKRDSLPALTSSQSFSLKKVSWNKSNKHLSKSSIILEHDHGEKDELKKSKSANNSTLSLHIAAYENSVEADSSKTTKFHGFTMNPPINLFEFPRQQKENIGNVPEVMQFKTSQKLINPNEDSRNQRAKKRSQKKEAEDEKKKAAEKKEADDENVRKDADKATQNEKETNEEACVPQKFAAEIGISREGVRPLLYYETPEKDYMVFREKNEGKAVCRSCYNLEKKSKNKNIVVIQRTFNMNIFEEDPLANHQFDCARITLKEKEDEQTANKLLVTRRKEKKEFKSQNDVAKLYPEQNKKLNLNEGQKKRLAYNLSRMVKQPEKISPRITRNRPQPLTGQKSSATLKAYGTPLGNKFPSDISLIAEPFDDVCEKLDNLDFGDNYETDVTEDTKITVIQSLGDGPSTFLRKLDEKIKQAKDS